MKGTSMKKVLATLCSMILAGVMLSACANNSSGKVRIALIMSHMSNSFTTTLANSAKEQGAAAGVSVTVFDGKKDASNQLNQIESAVSQGYKGIIVEPVSQEGVAPGLKAAKEADIPIITVAQKAKQQERASSFVGGDDTAAGKLEMEQAISAMGGKGTVAVLYGPMGSDGQVLRKTGYDEVLKSHPDVTLAFQQTANWDTAEALKVTENWLSTGKTINAIVAQNDSMAIGAQKAIDNAGKSQEIAVYGVDATDDGLNSIKSGGIDGTVSQDTAGMGRMAVDTIVSLINGKSVEKVNYTKATWITKKNADSVVVK